MKKITIIVIVISLMITSCAEKPRESGPIQKSIAGGIIEGTYDADLGLEVYLGIPFAKPPTGELRWKAPQPTDKWEGIIETKKFGPRPVQHSVFGDMNSRSEKESEDCLYLNVWSPAKKGEKGLPVLVYFYGGGFVAGDGAEPRYDGASMAQKGIVALTINYRLNIFGFFAHADLSAEASYGSSGNYGLLDQNLALKWVQENIEVFGGDPKRVTIAGESAGSISVSAQMSSPLSRDLIAGAIGESGAAINPTLFPVPLTQAESEGQDYMEATGYSSIEEMRSISTEELKNSYVESGRFGFSTVIDDYFYPNTLNEIFSAGDQAQVPLLLGWNSAEIPGFSFMQGPGYEEEAYIQKVKEAYPEDYEEVLTLYPHGDQKEIEWSATDLASDRFIAYSTWKWFDLHRKNTFQPVYRYLYSKLRPPETNPQNTGYPMPEAIGAPHACEIEYCMGNLHLIDHYAWTEDDFKVAETMSQFFANFIKTGNPNGEGLPEWPAADADDTAPPVMIINTVSKAVPAKNDERYRFLDKTYGNTGTVEQ